MLKFSLCLSDMCFLHFPSVSSKAFVQICYPPPLLFKHMRVSPDFALPLPVIPTVPVATIPFI